MEEMTASEILRRNADDNWSAGVAGIAMALDAAECNGRVFELLADKIDAELAEVRKKAAHAIDKPLSEVTAFYTGLYAKGAEPIGDWLDRWFLPRPRYEDGEPLRFDYCTDELSGVEKFIFLRSGGGCCQMQDADGNICNVYPGERVKRRPTPEALGADGLPIKAAETVYDTETGEEHVVRLPLAGTGKTFFEGGGYLDPAYLTHTPPDTQQKIDEDAEKFHCVYFGGYSACGTCPASTGELSKKSCKQQQIFDLLRRQRELDARTGGAE